MGIQIGRSGVPKTQKRVISRESTATERSRRMRLVKGPVMPPSLHTYRNILSKIG